MKLNKIHVYDMDGTIVDSSHRYQTASCGTRIDLEHWIANDIPEMIALDSLLPMAEEYKRDLQDESVYVIIATARACNEGDANYLFIERVLGKPDKFIHREGRNDERGGAELKIQAIKPLLNLKQFRNCAIHVFEDNIDYLKKLCDSFNGLGTYIPSKQGH